jgi:parvulin-like peptidyl-prolyl isomerase
MPSLRTKSISTKVTDEEYAQFEALAGGQTISEWARDVLLKATKPNSSEQTVLAEVLALRTILLNVHFAISQGQTLTAEEVKQLIERADQNKLSKAQQRLVEAATGGMP